MESNPDRKILIKLGHENKENHNKTLLFRLWEQIHIQQHFGHAESNIGWSEINGDQIRRWPTYATET